MISPSQQRDGELSHRTLSPIFSIMLLLCAQGTSTPRILDKPSNPSPRSPVRPARRGAPSRTARPYTQRSAEPLRPAHQPFAGRHPRQRTPPRHPARAPAQEPAPSVVSLRYSATLNAANPLPAALPPGLAPSV